MKILLANYRYFISGGPERYMFSVKKLLEQKGHEVIPFSVNYKYNVETTWSRYFVPPIGGDNEVYFREHSWNIKTLYKGLERAFYSKAVYHALKRLIDDTQPDSSLVLCYLKKLSPAVLVALKEAGLPVIVRLSDFCMLCPAQIFLRGTKICELCINGRLWPSIRYGCVQGSRSASVVNGFATLFHRWKRYFELIDAFIAPSQFTIEKMIEGGWSPEKLYHINTFVNLDMFQPQDIKRSFISYTGRIHSTKGVKTLVDAFHLFKTNGPKKKIKLVIAGDDKTPDALKMKCYIQERNIEHVIFTGNLDAKGITKLLSQSCFGVVPSICYDNMPNALLECLACGTPVIASNLGSLPEIVADGVNGLLFEPGNAEELAEKMRYLLENPKKTIKMGVNARAKMECEYNPELHYQSLIKVHEAVRREG